MTSHGLVLLAHGTRDALGPIELECLTAQVAGLLPETSVHLGYLSLREPIARDAIAAAVAAGATDVCVLPLLLTQASHAREDVPAIMAAAGAAHPDVHLSLLASLGTGDDLLTVAEQRLRALPVGVTDLVVFGRGGSNDQANADFAVTAQRLGQAVGARSTTAGYAALATPDLAGALEDLISTGAQQLVVFSWLVAHGRLIEQARETMHIVAGTNEVDIVDAGYFGDDPTVAAIVAQRVRDHR